MKQVVILNKITRSLLHPGLIGVSQTYNFDVFYVGGESNVDASLANLVVPKEWVTRLPNNDIGNSALMKMRKRNVENWKDEQIVLYKFHT